MNVPRLVALGVMTLAAFGALAETAGQKAYDSDAFAVQLACRPSGGTPNATQLITAMNDLDRLLPNVAPEEAAYLGKENSAVIAAPIRGSMQDQQTAALRYQALTSRPFYYAWRARHAFDRAKIVVDSVYDPQHIPAANLMAPDTVGVQLLPNPLRQEDADRIYRLISAIAPLRDLAREVDDFVDRDGNNRNSLMTELQRKDAKNLVLGLSYFLESILSCHFVSYAVKHKGKAESPARAPGSH